MLVGLGAAATAVALAFTATPAMAAGGFTQKVTPPNCTTTDFSGGSSKSGTTARAFSQGANIFCGVGSYPTLGVRVTLNGVSSPTRQSNTVGGGAIVEATVSGSGTAVSGRHTYGGTVRTT